MIIIIKEQVDNSAEGVDGLITDMTDLIFSGRSFRSHEAVTAEVFPSGSQLGQWYEPLA